MNEPFYLKENEETVIKVINNLKELRNSLINTGNNAIKHHVTKDKNDFAAWINESLNKSGLAFKIALIMGNEVEVKDQIIRVLDKELNKWRTLQKIKALLSK